MRAANEMEKTVAVFAEEDKLSLHRFKAGEAYRIGHGLGPVAAYLSIDEIIRVAREWGGPRSIRVTVFVENPDFVEACAKNGITFIGPKAETMRCLVTKPQRVRLQSPQAFSYSDLNVLAMIWKLPKTPKGSAALMLKASWGGGGRGMRPIYGPENC